MTTTAPARRVLLVTSDAAPIPEIEAALAGAGLEVRRCHDTGEWFPCVGLEAGACPLDADGGVDVVLDVRQHPWPDPTSLEIGVTCAIREHVPVAIIGRRPDPFGRWAGAVTDHTADVIGLCEKAIAASLAPLAHAASDAVTAVLDGHDLPDAPVAVRVERTRGRLHVVITGPDAPTLVRGMAVARAASAIRALDGRADAIEIDFVVQR